MEAMILEDQKVARKTTVQAQKSPSRTKETFKKKIKRMVSKLMISEKAKMYAIRMLFSTWH
jgi:hypothetical protein